MRSLRCFCIPPGRLLEPRPAGLTSFTGLLVAAVGGARRVGRASPRSGVRRRSRAAAGELRSPTARASGRRRRSHRRRSAVRGLRRVGVLVPHLSGTVRGGQLPVGVHRSWSSVDLLSHRGRTEPRHPRRAADAQDDGQIPREADHNPDAPQDPGRLAHRIPLPHARRVDCARRAPDSRGRPRDFDPAARNGTCAQGRAISAKFSSARPAPDVHR